MNIRDVLGSCRDILVIELSDENRCQLMDDASRIIYMAHIGSILQKGAEWLNAELLVLVLCMTSMRFLTQYTCVLIFQGRRQPTPCRLRVLFNFCVDCIQC